MGPLAQPEAQATMDFSRYTRIGLEEDWTFKRPAAFVLLDIPCPDMYRWNRLYQAICKQLADAYPQKFDKLPEAPEFITTQRRHFFVWDSGGKKGFLPVGRNVHADTTLDANYIRDNIGKLLKYFSVDEAALTVYQR